MGPTWISGNTVTENLYGYSTGTIMNCDALPDLVPFVQLKKREKHP